MAAAETAERRRGRINDDRGKKTATARTGKSVASAGRRKKSRPLRSADPRRRALRKNGAGSQKSAAREHEATEVGVGPNPSRQRYFLSATIGRNWPSFPTTAGSRQKTRSVSRALSECRPEILRLFGNEPKLVTRARGVLSFAHPRRVDSERHLLRACVFL